jgi:uncharacterized protein YjiS (DUF1127 family)
MRAGALAGAAWGRLAALPGRLLAGLAGWQQRARERRHLMSLDGRMLRDIGVSRADAWREGTKPFWRA